jgi:hypothetical protein
MAPGGRRKSAKTPIATMRRAPILRGKIHPSRRWVSISSPSRVMTEAKGTPPSPVQTDASRIVGRAPPALRSTLKTRSSAIRSRVRVDDREMQPNTWQKPCVDDAAEQRALPEGLHLGPSGSWKRCFKLGISVDCPREFRNRVQLECRCDYQEFSEDRARHRTFVDTVEGRYDAGGPHLVA